jgi:hypothetical protein
VEYVSKLGLGTIFWAAPIKERENKKNMDAVFFIAGKRKNLLYKDTKGFSLIKTI